MGNSLPLPLRKTEPEGRKYLVSTGELEEMSFGKPRWVNSGITDCRKSAPGLRISKPLPLFKTQVIPINVNSSKKGLPKCRIFHMFNRCNPSGLDLDVLYPWGHDGISSFPTPNNLDNLIPR